MATAQELFSLNTGSEEHIVIGTDRYITVPTSLKRIAVQFDHDVETVTFDCPRYWDNLDMSAMIIYINYKLPDGTLDAYPAKNITVDEDIMHFDWTISRNLTQYKGTITFLVCIKKTGADGVEVNHWNSELCSDMHVSEGMECQEQAQMEHSDLITQLLERMTVVEDINIKANEMQTLHDETFEAAALARDESNHIKNSYANAYKQSVSGNVIRVDDVSPLEHTANCYIHGKNLCSTNTFDNSNSNTRILNVHGVKVKKGRTYTFQCEATYVSATENDKRVQFIVSTDETQNANTINITNEIAFLTTDSILATGTYSKSFTVTVDGYLYIRIVAPNVFTLSNIQIEEGETATEYTPYIDPSTVTLTTCGSNIADIPDVTPTVYAKKMGNYLQWYADLPVGTEMIISADYNTADTSYGNVCWRIELNDGTLITIWSGDFTNSTYKRNSYTHVKTVDFSFDDIKSGTLFLGNGSTLTRTFKNITVNIGNTDLGYEEYNGITYTPQSDGTANVSSLSPTMTLFTDTDGMTIDLTYNRDNNKVIGDISAALDTLIAMQEATIVKLDNMSGGAS